MKLLELKANIRSFVALSDDELDRILKQCEVRTFQKNEALFSAGEICNSIVFLNSGLCRSLLHDSRGLQHTILFAMQGDFVGDFSSYLKSRPSAFSVIAIEKCEGVVIPRELIDLAFENIQDSHKLGRFLIERYYLRLQDLMEARRVKEPLEMFNYLSEIYPGIHQRVPQNIVASFLGITPVHLSRLKSREVKKISN